MKRILIVDDDSLVRSSLKRLLERAEVDVTLASGRTQAKALLKHLTFDVVLSDWDLGDGFINGGISVLEAAPAGTVRWLMSGAEGAEATGKRGFDRFWPKPIEPAELIAALSGAPQDREELTPHPARGELRPRPEEEDTGSWSDEERRVTAVPVEGRLTREHVRDTVAQVALLVLEAHDWELNLVHAVHTMKDRGPTDREREWWRAELDRIKGRIS